MLEFVFDLGPLHLRFTITDTVDDGEAEHDSAADSLTERAPDWRHPDNELDARPAPLGFRA